MRSQSSRHAPFAGAAILCNVPLSGARRQREDEPEWISCMLFSHGLPRIFGEGVIKLSIGRPQKQKRGRRRELRTHPLRSRRTAHDRHAQPARTSSTPIPARWARRSRDAFKRADTDDNVRAVIVTGAGRAFCAGADVSGGAASFDTSGKHGAGVFASAKRGRRPASSRRSSTAESPRSPRSTAARSASASP